MIETVLGPVPAHALGRALAHEHVLVGSEANWSQFPHLFDREARLASAIEYLTTVRAHGIDTIVDATVMGLGRDVRFLQAVASSTGLNIVVATGAYVLEQLPWYFATRPAEVLADAFRHDLEAGIQGTAIRAAFIKVVTDKAGLTPDVEKTLRAAAQAHLQTGAPILTHSHAGSMNGLVQQDLFDKEGVDLTKVVIGHSGDTEDLDYLRRLADRGSFLGMDRYGGRYLATDKRNPVVLRLCELGYAERMMLANDSVVVYDKFENTPRMHYLIDEVLPQLRAIGVHQSWIDTMVIDNVRRWLER